MKWLESSDLIAKLKTENIEKKSLDNIIFNISINLEYEMHEEDKFLFFKGLKKINLDDLGEKFYIIINGTVEVLKTRKRTYKLNAEEYYLILKEMYIKGQHDLWKKTSIKNNHIYPLNNSDDIKNFDDIFFKVKYRKSLLVHKQIEELKILFIQYKKDPKDYNIDFDKLEKSGLVNNRDIYLKSFMSLSFEENLVNYRNVENLNEKNNVIIYEHYVFLKLGKGEYFGHMAFDNTNKTRTATVKVQAGINLCYLDSVTYNNYIYKERQKMLIREKVFLINNFFFKSIHLGYFEKKYFSHFVGIKLNRRQMTFEQNQDLNNLYFIHSGEIELTFNGNLIDFINLLKFFVDNKLPQDLKIPDFSENGYSYQEMNKKRIIKVLLVGSQEILGLLEYKLKKKSFFSAKVISEYSKLYKLDNLILDKLIAEDSNILSSINSLYNNKVKSLINRLCTIYNHYITSISEKTSINEMNCNILKTYNGEKLKRKSPLLILNQRNHSGKPNIEPLNKPNAQVKSTLNTESFNSYYSQRTERNNKRNLIFDITEISKDNEFRQDNIKIKELKSSIINLQNYGIRNRIKDRLLDRIKDSYRSETKINDYFLCEYDEEIKEKQTKDILKKKNFIELERILSFEKIFKNSLEKYNKENFESKKIKTPKNVELSANIVKPMKNDFCFKNNFKVKFSKKNKKIIIKEK